MKRKFKALEEVRFGSANFTPIDKRGKKAVVMGYHDNTPSSRLMSLLVCCEGGWTLYNDTGAWAILHSEPKLALYALNGNATFWWVVEKELDKI
jgi:hypothetical protein